MDHYVFDCISAIYLNNVTSADGEVSKLVYLTLYDRMSFRSGLSPYRCAVSITFCSEFSAYFKKTLHFPSILFKIQIYKRIVSSGVVHLAISEKEDCTGLKERFIKTPIDDPTKTPEWKDGFLLLYFSKTLDTPRPKLSNEWIVKSNPTVQKLIN